MSAENGPEILKILAVASIKEEIQLNAVCKVVRERAWLCVVPCKQSRLLSSRSCWENSNNCNSMQCH